VRRRGGLDRRFALTRWIASELWESRRPIRHFAGVAASGVGGPAAALAPVRSALRVDPTVALSYE
jgi:hypothetical protein